MTLYTIAFIILNFFNETINDWRPVKELGIPVPLAYELHGIDVSHHNGRVNWKKVSTVQYENLKIDFTFVKATEGGTFIDETFKTNWREAKLNNISRGAYHYFIPWVDAQKQFATFSSQVKLEPGDLPPVLDIEEPCLLPDKIVVRAIRNWLVLTEKKYGVKPIIYTNPLHYNLYIKGNFDKYPLWIANYSAKTLGSYPKSKLHFWQFSNDGRVPGIKGPVDINVCMQNANTFELLKLQ